MKEAKYRSLIESMDDSIYMVDRDCCYIFMNKKHLERIGRSAELFRERRYQDFHTTEEFRNFSANIDKIFLSGETIEERYEKDGRIYIRIFSPIKNIENDGIVAVNINSREITEEGEAFGKEDSIYIVDKDYRYLSINAEHIERLEINSQNAFIGKTYDEFHPKGRNETFSRLINEVFETGEVVRDEYMSGDFHFTRRFCPVKDILTDQVIAVTVVSTNVTDQKITEKSLMEANKKLNLLNSITRHDILNQLTALKGYVLLSLDICRDEELKNFLEKQKAAADTIYNQISFTKDYQDIGVCAPTWQEISNHIDNSAKTLNIQGINIEKRFGNLKIFADPLLEKVFYNLMENSVRHGGDFSKLSFYYERIPYGIKLVYEDDGCGIKDEDKEIIFKHGYGKNTGLGLFLIREIISITGLEIHETGIFGEGAKFEIMVPDRMYSV